MTKYPSKDQLIELRKDCMKSAQIDMPTSIAAGTLRLLDLIDKLEQESIEREKTVKVWIQSEKQARDYAIKLQNKLETAEKALTFYADEKSMHSLTGLPFGRRAREALKEIEEMEKQ